VALDAMDDSGLAQMCLSSANACAAWQPYAPSAFFTLAPGDGKKTVNAWFADVWGNVTPAPASAAIVLDTTPPLDGQLTITGGDGQLGLSWKNFSDALTGVVSFKVVFATDTPPAPGCAAGTLLLSGWGADYTHVNLDDGVVYAYRVCAVDGAGNTSAGATAKAFPAPEYIPPVGSVTLDGGATLTRDPAVTVQIDASDDSGVASMCLSTTPRCLAWQKFASPVTVNVPNGSGRRTVYVGLRDVWGNTTAAPLTAHIQLDTAPPLPNVIATTPGSQQIAVSWTAARDPDSGVAGYQLVVLPGASPPANYCNSGTLLYTGADLAYTHGGLIGGQTYTYRLCATDNAGNVSSGVVRAAVAGP
jgi:hypothetical protein